MLQTIILSFVNKNYYYIAILFLCYVFLFTSKDFVFSYFVEVSLNFKLERILFLKKNSPKVFQCMSCRMDIWNLFFSTNVLLFNVLTISIRRFVLFFSILSQNKKFYDKRKNNTQSSSMVLFLFYVEWTYILRGSLFIKVESQWI